MSTVAENLETILRHANAARMLNDHELADSLMRGLWASLPATSMEAAVIEEAIDRLRNSGQ